MPPPVFIPLPLTNLTNRCRTPFTGDKPRRRSFLILCLFFIPYCFADTRGTSTSESIPSHLTPNEPEEIALELETFQHLLNSSDETGPYDPALSEIYFGMGIYLQRSGQHQAAIKQFNQAMQVERINLGIYSLAQSPALRANIASKKALQQIEETSADYYRLLWLHQKNLDASSPKFIPLFVELSRWHLTAYQLEQGGGQIDHLVSANELISRALNLVEQNSTSDKASTYSLPKLLRNTALVNFFLAHHQGDEWSSSQDSHFSFSSMRDMEVLPMRIAVLSRSAYNRGRKAHETLTTLLDQDKNSGIEQRVQFYTELGDWHLLFGKQHQALETYRKAIALIPQTESPLALYEKLFNRPILLPAVRNENAGPETGNRENTALARIKVDIAVNGWGSNIEILTDDAENKKRIAKQTRNSLRNARFRPRFVNNNPVASLGEIVEFPLIH